MQTRKYFGERSGNFMIRFTLNPWKSRSLLPFVVYR